MIKNGTKVKDSLYGVKLVLFMLFLSMLFSYATYNIFESYMPKNFAAIGVSKKSVYLLKSKETQKIFVKFGIGDEVYIERLKNFAKFIKDISYEAKIIEEDKISSLKEGDILILLDTLSLNSDTQNKIKTFLQKGGNLLFNYNTSFSDEDAKFIGDKFLNSITGLKFNKEFNYIDIKKEGGYLTPKLLSPLTSFNKNGKRLELILYDDIPIFEAPKNLKPDLLLTNFTQSQTPLLDNDLNMISLKKAGMLWHGYFQKGKWAYFNFPSYAFIESKESIPQFQNLIKGIFNFFENPVVIRKYPYIDTDNIMFISEDTEYKFENLRRFSSLSQKYQIPVTAFLVGYLAKENPEVVKEASNNPFLEFGSHSYSHKKIVGKSDEYIKKETIGSKDLIEKISGRKVRGFRPPREEIDEKMYQYLNEGGYKYVMEKEKDVLMPFFGYKNIMTIPRHGIDDYIYLINLDWDQEKILNQILKEATILKYLNGIYTLSIHTHLLAYGKNINILEKFFRFLKNNPDFKPLKGYDIYKRVLLAKNIDLSYTITRKNIIVVIKNKNRESVKDFTFKLYPDNATKLGNIVPEISNVKINYTKQKEGAYKVIIKELKPNSKLTLFIRYKTS